ncbi:hypothetical protein [Halococcus saccharolyticus]|uniref:hypothetical protein n=1 Tax=Halococcus saccharolyticus TaxID=62319 RepID=UPI00067805A7
MGEFRTRGGRCVVEHGEVRLEPLGLGGRLRRHYENLKLAHRQRYERGLLRFGFVLLMGVYSVGQFLYALVFGNEWLAVLGIGGAVGFLVVVYGYFLVRKRIRRWFRGYTDERTIPVRAIESIDPRPKRPFRAPHIVIHYSEYGTEAKRYVGVCTQTPLADEEFETAKAVLMDEHDLPITTA